MRVWNDLSRQFSRLRKLRHYGDTARYSKNIMSSYVQNEQSTTSGVPGATDALPVHTLFPIPAMTPPAGPGRTLTLFRGASWLIANSRLGNADWRVVAATALTDTHAVMNALGHPTLYVMMLLLLVPAPTRSRVVELGCVAVQRVYEDLCAALSRIGGGGGTAAAVVPSVVPATLAILPAVLALPEAVPDALPEAVPDALPAPPEAALDALPATPEAVPDALPAPLEALLPVVVPKDDSSSAEAGNPAVDPPSAVTSMDDSETLAPTAPRVDRKRRSDAALTPHSKRNQPSVGGTRRETRSCSKKLETAPE
jgi:hypothetical protein